MGKRSLSSALQQSQWASQQQAKAASARAQDEQRAANKKRKIAAGGSGGGGGKNKRRKGEQEQRRDEVPFGRGERILLIGEGNFSFARSLLSLPSSSSSASITPSLLYATSFDSRDVCCTKYPDAVDHLAALETAGAHVAFSVDATALLRSPEVKSWVASFKSSSNGQDVAGGWDKIVFNFPHVGMGIKDQARNVKANQALLLGWLRACATKGVLREGGSHVRAPKAKGKKTPVGGKGKGKGRPGKVESDDDSDMSEPEEPFHAEEDEDDEHEDDAAAAPAAGVEDEAPAPTTRGTLLLTLRTCAPYSLWSASSLATRGPLLAPSILPPPIPVQPRYTLIRSFAFFSSAYPGYAHRRTKGADKAGESELLKFSASQRGKRQRGELDEEAGGKEEARTWVFELPDPDWEKDPRDWGSTGTKGKKKDLDRE